MSHDRGQPHAIFYVPWCCAHRKLLYYISFCVTMLVISAVLEILEVWG